MELNKFILSHLIIALILLTIKPSYGQSNTVSYMGDNSENHKMDIYYNQSGKEQGINVLALTAGGFIMTDKDDLKDKATELSQSGYNVYVPNYSDVMYSEVCNKSHKVWYLPLQEIMAAASWIEKNEKITDLYVYGESAGGIVALNFTYLNEASSFHKDLEKEFGNKTKLGSHTLSIKGVFTVSAGVFDLSLFEAKNNTPLTMIHASCDQMVPYNTGTPLMCDEDAIEVFGSNSIYNRIKTYHSIQANLLSICNANHDITDNNFLDQFKKFTNFIESKHSFKSKREVFKPTLNSNEMIPCDNIICK